MDEHDLNNEADRLTSAAWAFAKSGDFAAAVQEIEKATTLRPAWNELWIFKGSFLRKSGRLDDARAALRKAIELDASEERAWTELGLVNRDGEFYEAAAFCFRESVRLHPHYPVFTMLAKVELTFDPEAALKHAECALSLNPSWDEAIAIRDRAKRELGEEKKVDHDQGE